MIVNQISDEVRASLERYTGPDESQPEMLQHVLENMLANIPGWLEELGANGAPAVVIAKYTGILRALSNTGLPLKLRARDAERTVREIITSVEWYYRGDKRDLDKAKEEALRPCQQARDILSRRVRR